VRRGDALYRTETFGPLVGVASFSTFDEAVDLANGHGYGLSAAIYTSDPQAAFRFRERVGAGMLSVNNSTSGAEAHLPFGGNGRSGNGSRQSGRVGARPVHPLAVDELGLRRRLQKAQMDTPDPAADLSFRP
jgi:aldehyde dehydrogenase (NAD+)